MRRSCTRSTRPSFSPSSSFSSSRGNSLKDTTHCPWSERGSNKIMCFSSQSSKTSWIKREKFTKDCIKSKSLKCLHLPPTTEAQLLPQEVKVEQTVRQEQTQTTLSYNKAKSLTSSMLSRCSTSSSMKQRPLSKSTSRSKHAPKLSIDLNFAMKQQMIKLPKRT